MRLVQFRTGERRAVAAVESGGAAVLLRDVESVYALALQAIESRRTIQELAQERRTRETIDLDALESEGRLLAPLDHPTDPARCWITGTGLTHLGSAQARAQMHSKVQGDEAELSDSMRMFKWGLDRGKPAGGGPGVQPEWFFKGNGSTLLASGQPLLLPDFSMDGGEEPEVVGLYVIANDGTPCRLGYALGNEFTDHAMERMNYLYLAHSKLRPCSVGPELRLGPLPPEINGTSRILRDGKVLWEKPFISGEANMSHRLSSLEHHHFKYPLFRHPGDVHLHFFGTSTLSVQDGIVPRPGDLFEIDAPEFGRPLRNPLAAAVWPVPSVRPI
jgi:hypothetical protein